MKLSHEWKRVIKRAWSFRLAILAALLSATEVGIQILAAERPSPYFAAGAAIAGLFAAVARIISQAGFNDEQDRR